MEDINDLDITISSDCDNENSLKDGYLKMSPKHPTFEKYFPAEILDSSIFLSEPVAGALIISGEKDLSLIDELNDILEKKLESLQNVQQESDDLTSHENRSHEKLSKIYEEKCAELNANVEDLEKIFKTLQDECGRLMSELNFNTKRFSKMQNSVSCNQIRLEKVEEKLKTSNDKSKKLKENIDKLEQSLVDLLRANGNAEKQFQKSLLELEKEKFKTQSFIAKTDMLEIKRKSQLEHHKHKLNEIKKFSTETCRLNETFENTLLERLQKLPFLQDDNDIVRFRPNQADVEQSSSNIRDNLNALEKQHNEIERNHLNIRISAAIQEELKLKSEHQKLRNFLLELENTLSHAKSTSESKNEDLQRNVAQIEKENDDLQKELKHLLEINNSLFVELAIYKTLLISDSLEPSIGKFVHYGDVQISEIENNGQYIELKNMKKVEKLTLALFQ